MNKNNYATHHIKASAGEISDTVIMMGDPLRAKKFSADRLEDSKLICDIRGINIWTGKYNGNIITVMGHGMGISSIAIYAHELFEFFDVERIIRLGSCASYVEDLNRGDIIIGDKYYTYSTFAEGYGKVMDEPIGASESLIEAFKNALANDGTVNYKAGGVYSSEWFYAPAFFGEGIKKGTVVEEGVANGSIVGKEMESHALQTIANHFNKEAITVLTVIDNLKTKDYSSADDKVSTDKMGEIALKALFN